MLEFYRGVQQLSRPDGLERAAFRCNRKAITGSTVVKFGEVELDFGENERLSMREAIIKYWPEGAGAAPSLDDLAKAGGPRAAPERYNVWAKQTGANYAASKGTLSDGEWTGLLFETIAEHHLIQPTILYDFPTDISPLSKQKPDDPSLTERFEIYVGGHGDRAMASRS